MKAIVSNGVGEDLVVAEILKPTPKKEEVVIKINAAAVNHRDLLIQKGQYVNLKSPIVLGSDGAGIIDEFGENVKGFKVGQEVIINPGLEWGNNPKAPGSDYRVLGLPENGTFAEYVVVPASAVYPKPKHLSFEQAAALPLSGLVAYRALVTRGQAAKGQKILITGIGGAVAQSMLQFAIALETEIYFTSGDDDKIEKAVAIGAKAGVNYKQEDWDKQLKDLAGSFDLIIDSAAGKGFQKLIELAKPGGKLVFFGATTGAIPEIKPQSIYLKQLDLLGTSMGSPQDFEGMLELINEKKIIPMIDQILPLDKAQEALQKMKTASQFGKLVLSINK